MADMSWTGYWTSVTVIDKFIHPCNYTFSIDFTGGSDDAVRQHMAFSRIKYLIDDILNDTIHCSMNNPLLPVLKDTYTRVVTFSTDPIEVVVAITLWHKILQITEGEIDIERIGVSTDQGDNLVCWIDQLFMEETDLSIVEDPYKSFNEKAWWNRPDAGATDWMEITDTEDPIKKKANVKLDYTDWPEYLQWDFDKKVLDTPAPDNVISIKPKKWKPEVIPGDKS